MGTRADFYIKREDQMNWLGSIGFDGHPWEIPQQLLLSNNCDEYEELVLLFLNSQDDSNLPIDGWVGAWNNSLYTDFSYIFDNGKVMCSYFGQPLVDPLNVKEILDVSEDKRDKLVDFFPDMSSFRKQKK